MQLAHAAPDRDQRRTALAAAVVLLLLLSVLLPAGVRAAAIAPTSVPVSDTADAADGTGSACTDRPPFKAVIVVGPVGSDTARFRGWANEIASAARAAGMAVCKVYTPDADAATVKEAAKGADLFVTLMHGNGYPKPDRRAQDGTGLSGEGDDTTAHGLGLNAAKGSSALRYYGADWVRANLHLAPDAIVILSHMCFTSGNSEDFDRIPSYALAVDHVDNFAAGFLASDSLPDGHPSAVMALQGQHFDPSDPKGDLIDTLMTKDVSLDRAFMSTYTRNTGSAWEGTYLPNFGAIGTTDFYVTQRADGGALRSRGTLHLDPDLVVDGKWPAAPDSWDPQAPDVSWLDKLAGRPKGISKGSGEARFGYVRSIAGDLSFTTSAWRASAGAGGDRDPGPGDPAPGGTTTMVAVPRVRGMSRADAKARLLAAGLRVSDTYRKVASASIDKGKVLNTSPTYKLPDGTTRKVRRGTTVQITLSSGSGTTDPTPTPSPTPSVPGTTRVAIPKVKGLTIDQAKAALHLAGLEVKGPRISIATSLVPRRHVVGTSPSRFRDGKPRTIPRGTAIQLKVSTGP